jgi:predicted MPP superfamily phosphohydrolase
MQPIEQLRIAVFLTVVVVVYFSAARIVVRSILAKRGLPELASSRRAVWTRRLIVGLAAVGTCCIAYGFLIEPFWLEVTHVRIACENWPKGSRPLRIVQISDLHSEARARLEDRLPDVIAREKPDVIVFTGDSLNTAAGLPTFRRCMTRLAAIAPTFAVRGNWDVWYWSHLDLFGSTGVLELNGEAVRIDVGGNPVWVAGVPVDSERQIGAALRTIPQGELRVFLYHYPDEIREASRQKADLYCAGHIHGGQLALPFYGALVTLSRFGKRFESGLFRFNRTWLYVNRGIGMEGGRIPRVRFCARPEVTVIDVRPAGVLQASPRQ